MQVCVIGRSGARAFLAARRLPLLALALASSLLAGCGTMSGTGGTPPATGAASAAIPLRPADPLAAFAARAQPGQQEDIAPAPGNPPVTVRLVRSYAAASGRDCRELSVGFRAARPALYCEEPGGWAAARPLLRGGAVGRP